MKENTADRGSDGGLVIITADGLEHRYVASQIAACHRVRAILICDPAPRRSWRKVVRASPLIFWDKVMWRLFLAVIGNSGARNAALQEVLGTGSQPFAHDQICRVGRPGDGTLERVVADLKPDVLAIYGTSIIPDTVLARARRIALNMHTGISPRYRGTACSFWPIHNGEPEWVGATVHECTAKVDGGQIFAVRRARLHREDGLHHVFARAVVAGASAYTDVIRAALSGSLIGEVQDLQVGQEYRGAARGLRSELVARWRLVRLRRHWLEELDN